MKLPINDGNWHIAILVIFVSQKDGVEEEHRFYVPDSLMWSARGLRYVFEATRREKLSPPGSKTHDDEEWDSWHLIEVRTLEEGTHLIEGLKGRPPEPQKRKVTP
jgi:hypothetical protein